MIISNIKQLRVLFLALILFSPLIVRVQGQGGATYPGTAAPYISPAASASGMTAGLEKGSTVNTITLANARAGAENASRLAAAASMARAGSDAIEQRNQTLALEQAREVRRRKIEVSERLKWQKVTAANAYKQVSRGEMSGWRDENGNVKIGQNEGLPAEFVESVRRLDAAEAAAYEQNRGFKPFKGLTSKVNETVAKHNPYQDTGLQGPKPLPPISATPPRSSQPQPQSLANADDRSRRIVPKIKPPRLFSKIGNNRQVAAQPPVGHIQANGHSSAAAPPSPGPIVSAAPIARSAPVARSAPQPRVAAKPNVASTNAASIPARSGADLIGEKPKKQRGNWFAKRSTPKQKSNESVSLVDNTLFPTSVPVAGKKGRQSRVGSNKPIRIGNRSGNAQTSASSTVNKHGNSFYVVGGGAQFMKYGSSVNETHISALTPGTVVRMTKPGEKYATVSLPNGTSGVIQVNQLQASQSGF